MSTFGGHATLAESGVSEDLSLHSPLTQRTGNMVSLRSSLSATAALLIAALPLCAVAQVVNPQDGASVPAATLPLAAEQRAAELGDLLTMRGREHIDEFVDGVVSERLRVEPHRRRIVGSIAALLHETGGAERTSVTRLGEREAELRFFGPLYQDWVLVRVIVEAQAPHLIAGISGARVDQTDVLADRFVPTADTMRAYLNRLVAADRFSGAIQVSRGDRVVFEGGFGMQSREHGVPLSTGTRISIGSVYKMFTATAILQLIEQDKLSLTRSVAEVLPGVLREDVARRVQIQHLLTHTSGLGDFLFTREMEGRARDRYRTMSDYLPMLQDDTLAFEPGARFRYSNAGFLLLGAIVERVSGLPYETYLRERIFGPAGMTATATPALDRTAQGLASGYEIEFDGTTPLIVSDRYTQVVVGTPAGGGFSTVEDLRRFVRALKDGRLIGPTLRRMMLTPKPELGAPEYGYGIQIFRSDASVVGHTGGGPGTSAVVEFSDDDDLVIVTLGNLAVRNASVMRRLRYLGEVSHPGH
jgi:CubicO group peptidase (beta-lactamase class C family)